MKQIISNLTNLYKSRFFILLHHAQYNNVSSFKWWIEQGADVNIAGYNGYTALHVAALFGHIDIVKALLHANADCSIKDKLGNTPLSIAKITHQYFIAAAILEHTNKGRSLSQMDPETRSILLTYGNQETAAKYRVQQRLIRTITMAFGFDGKYDIGDVKKHIQNGADPFLEDAKGMTPYQKAKILHRTRIVKFMKELKSSSSAKKSLSLR